MLLDRFLPRIEFDSYEDFKANYKVNVPENFNFGFDIVDAWADSEPEKKALVWCDDHDHERIFTFTDIKKLSNRAANFFRSIGIRKGTVVMLILRRRWEYWVCATALHKLGAILIPGSLQLTKKDIVYRGNSASVQTIVCVNDPFVIEQIETAEGDVPSLQNKVMVVDHREGWLTLNDELERFSDVLERPTDDQATRWDDIMLVYFTSGTTGMPKMVQHNFAYPLGHIITAKYWQRVEENKLHMSVSDSGWAKFGWGKIYGQWICGAVVFAYDMDKFVPLHLLEKITKYKVTTFCAPPTMFRFMLQEDVTKFDLSCIHHCCIAGEPLNPEVFKKWYNLTGLELCEGFGQSEGPVLIANFQWFKPIPGSTGKPSPLFDIQLIDSDGNVCEDGDEGTIAIMDVKHNPPTGLFTGYFKNPEMTEEKLGGAYYDTGDVAWRDSKGYYWFVGRNDDVIKCSGYRIGPFEVESAMLEHPAVVECAITGAPDPIRGQVVKATVVLAEGYEGTPALTKELQNHVKHVTAPYKYPRVIEYVEELPKTLGGKIKRAQIRRADEQAD
ncbi:MAG TPA: AMP-binding protein [Candidatus Ruminococcus gallistercoris]|nr:AMP-binding protein [Candidatus Ruminococcus gallistercoris]